MVQRDIDIGEGDENREYERKREIERECVREKSRVLSNIVTNNFLVDLALPVRGASYIHLDIQ